MKRTANPVSSPSEILQKSEGKGSHSWLSRFTVSSTAMVLLLGIFLAVLTVFVAMAFYYEHPKAEIPHGFSQRGKLYLVHFLMNFGIGLVSQT